MFGIWSSTSKKFVFGICEPSKTKAWKALRNQIGKDAFKWRFEARKIKNCAQHQAMFNKKYKTEKDD